MFEENTLVDALQKRLDIFERTCLDRLNRHETVLIEQKQQLSLLSKVGIKDIEQIDFQKLAEEKNLGSVRERLDDIEDRLIGVEDHILADKFQCSGSGVGKHVESSGSDAGKQGEPSGPASECTLCMAIGDNNGPPSRPAQGSLQAYKSAELSFKDWAASEMFEMKIFQSYVKQSLKGVHSEVQALKERITKMEEAEIASGVLSEMRAIQERLTKMEKAGIASGVLSEMRSIEERVTKMIKDERPQFTKFQEEVKANHRAVQNALSAVELKLTEANACTTVAVKQASSNGTKSSIDMESTNACHMHDVDAELRKDSEVKQVLEDEHLEASYMLHESMWDAWLLLGLPVFDIQSTIYLGIAVCINVVVQAVFCLISWVAFAQPQESSERDMQMWRWNSAHDVANVNDIWPFSLASRICGGDGSLPLSGQQQSTYDAVGLYRPPAATLAGEVMCVFCLLCFWTLLWCDCKGTLLFGRSMWQAVAERTSIIPIDGGIRLESISRPRCVLAWAIVLLRFAVLITLGMVGSIWLSRTTSIGDLLLNAVALELILNVDEMMYAALAPGKVKTFVDKCGPLRLWHVKHGIRIDAEAFLGVLGILVLLPTVYLMQVRQTSALVKSAGEILCGGTRNFVYGVSPLGLVYIHDNMSQLHDFIAEGTFAENAHVLALDEVISGASREEWRYGIYEPSLQELRARVSMPIGFALSMGSDCQDLLTEAMCQEDAACRQYRETLRFKTGDMSLEWCSDVEPHCFGRSSSALLTRALCPLTCGCRSLIKGTFVIGDGISIFGCPMECGDPKHYQADVTQCLEDAHANNSLWQKWMQEARLHDRGSPVLRDDILVPLEQQGCVGLEGISTKRDLCLGWRADDERRLPVKPLIGMCPRTCGCFPSSWGEDSSCPDPCVCKGKVNKYANYCQSNECKALVFSLHEEFFHPFHPSNMVDFEAICTCDFLMTTKSNSPELSQRELIPHLCENQCFGPAALLFGVTQPEEAAYLCTTTTTTTTAMCRDRTCWNDCTSEPATCTDLQQIILNGCLYDCPFCYLEQATARLGCADSTSSCATSCVHDCPSPPGHCEELHQMIESPMGCLYDCPNCTSSLLRKRGGCTTR